MTEAVTRVRVAPALRRYVVEILTATREHRDVYLGASPRAGVALMRAAKALALLRGRDFVVPKDVKDLAVRCLAHRIMLSPDAKVHGVTAESVVAKLLETVPVPQSGELDRGLSDPRAAIALLALPPRRTSPGGSSEPGSSTSSRFAFLAGVRRLLAVGARHRSAALARPAP